MIKLSKLYCKCVIDTLFKNALIFKKNKDISNKLEDEIYESYLKLEKIISEESTN